MEIRSFFLLLCVSHQVSCWNIRSDNSSDILTRYVEHCGQDLLCSTLDKVDGSSDENKKVTPKKCPTCSCTNDCEVNRNCCPDKFLTRKCVHTKFLFKNQSFAGENLYLMVSSCPQINSNILENSCQTPINETNFLTEVPVYSPRTNTTYVNVQCSRCHGENEVIPWRYYIECPQDNADLDFYTNANHLWYDLQQNDCTIEYMPPFNINTTHCNKEPRLVGECNITGYWEEYNEDILIACRQFRNRYGVFQNIFCFFCNTAKKQRPPSLLNDSNINVVTPVPYECLSEGLENTCMLTCSECMNNLTSNDENIYAYSDAIVELTEEYDSEKSEYHAFIIVRFWDLVDELKTVVTGNNMTMESNEDEKVNLTLLYEEFVRSGGHENWCQEEHTVDKFFPGYNARRDCNCDDDCYKYSACCPDVAFYQRVDCVPSFIGEISDTSNREYYYLISKCPIDYKFSYVKSRCEEPFDLSLFNIPLIDLGTNKSYKNLYCFSCHSQRDMRSLNFTDIRLIPWNITLVCSNIIFPMSVTSYTSLLQLAGVNNCSIQFTTTNVKDKCQVEQNEIIDKCNSIGIIESVSRNAKILCENTGSMVMKKSSNSLFKNKICDFCNNKVYEESLSKCYIIGNAKKDDTNALLCESGALDVREYPFKNAYCRDCNSFSYQSVKDLEFTDNSFSYRELFSISVQISPKTEQFAAKDCSKGEFKDNYKNICRKIVCAKGKYFADGSCTYLIPYAKDLRYRLGLQVLVSSNQDNRQKWDLQAIIQREIYEGDVELEEIYKYSNERCTYFNSGRTNRTSFQALLSLSIINNRHPIPRQSLEARLLNLLNATIRFDDVLIEFQESAKSWYLPLFVHQTQYINDGCYMKRFSDSYDDTITSNKYDVNTLLQCSQIQLEENEYVLSDEHSHVYVEVIKRNFKINEFTRNENGSIRICLDSYKPLHNVLPEGKQTLMDELLTVTTYICTIMSLLFLFATFVVYCILRILRTVPGKNIMCFSLSLFFAQLLSIIRSSIPENTTACSWIGGFTHYFWISAFAWTNVCCFHMFKLFVKHSLVHGDLSADRKLFIKYSLISFIIPFVPVGVNLVIAESEIDSLRFGYGGSRCFLTSPLAVLTTFISPIVLQVLFNITMFSITYHFIRNTPKVQSTKERNELSIFFKLFILTGVTWVFMIVDGFFDTSPFTFLATIISGSLGVFIFISYVCNKNIFRLLRYRLCPRDSLSSNARTSSSTNKTHTHSNRSTDHMAKNELHTTEI